MSGDEQRPILREQDRLLPVANINRIMKKALPPHAKVSKGAKETMQECVSEFIGFITSESSDLLNAEKRKTITGDDLINSMEKLGFDPYCEFLAKYLEEYRNKSNGKRSKQQRPIEPPSHLTE